MLWGSCFWAGSFWASDACEIIDIGDCTPKAMVVPGVGPIGGPHGGCSLAYYEYTATGSGGNESFDPEIVDFDFNGVALGGNAPAECPREPVQVSVNAYDAADCNSRCKPLTTTRSPAGASVENDEI